MNHRITLLAGALLGLTGVAFGAFGAHALRATLLQRGMLEVWQTAVQYQLIHAVALVALAGWLRGAGQADGADPGVSQRVGDNALHPQVEDNALPPAGWSALSPTRLTVARGAFSAAGWLWTGGVIFFSGSLYLLALGGPRWLGPITPFGGIALLAGWAWVLAAAWRAP